MFSPNRLVCIDSWVFISNQGEGLVLLAEVIQMVPERDRCWARPLALARKEDFQLTLIHDLRETAQLILPAHLFREAVDTEVIPLVTALFKWDQATTGERSANDEKLNRQALHQFINGLLNENFHH